MKVHSRKKSYNNIPKSIKDTEFIVKTLPTKKISGPNDFTDKFY